MTSKRYLIAALVMWAIGAMLALATVSWAQTEWVDVIIQIPTPKTESRVLMVGDYNVLNYYPVHVDTDAKVTTYLCRVQKTALELETAIGKLDGKLTKAIKAGKNGEKMWSSATAWNDWHKDQQALAEKVLLYDRTDLEFVDGKPQMVTQAVSVESARASVIDFDIKKARVPVKFSGTAPAIDQKELKATAVEVER